jgi:hypothetical protein
VAKAAENTGFHSDETVEIKGTTQADGAEPKVEAKATDKPNSPELPHC